MISSSSLHDVERPPPDEDIHTLVPGLVQSEPRHAGGQQTHHSHGGAAELTCQSVSKAVNIINQIVRLTLELSM